MACCWVGCQAARPVDPECSEGNKEQGKVFLKLLNREAFLPQHGAPLVWWGHCSSQNH